MPENLPVEDSIKNLSAKAQEELKPKTTKPKLNKPKK